MLAFILIKVHILLNRSQLKTKLKSNIISLIFLCSLLFCSLFRVIIVSKETPDSDNDATCAELKADEGFKSSVNNCTISRSFSRPMSICSEPEKKWVDVISGESNILPFALNNFLYLVFFSYTFPPFVSLAIK